MEHDIKNLFSIKTWVSECEFNDDDLKVAQRLCYGQAVLELAERDPRYGELLSAANARYRDANQCAHTQDEDHSTACGGYEQ